MFRQLSNPKFYFMILSDAAIFTFTLVVAYLIRFEFSLNQADIWQLRELLLWVVPLKSFIFFMLGLYRGMWRFTSVRDFWKLAQACLIAMLLIMAIVLFIYRFAGYSRAIFVIDGGLTFILSGGLRMAIRFYFASQIHYREKREFFYGQKYRRRVLIVGAGAAGEKILREISENYQLHYEVIGFIDDDPSKQGRSIHGVSVLGHLDEMYKIVADEDIDEILIAIPSASGEKMRHIINNCKRCNIVYKTLPGIGEIIDGRVSVKALRDVKYEDLLGRKPVELDTTGIRRYLDGRTIMITGCGSIGSELCRQVIRYQPKSLILVDASEANLFHIQMELQHELYYQDFVTILGHVQDRQLMVSVFQKFRPQVVFHAAAYKHGPLLESNPWEAVTNNIVGTQVVMELATEYEVERFVLVSTDKAVKPTNVMGASKRVAELLLQCFRGNGTKFVAVRFGNVIGSSGSVIPLFRRQIEQGGPVTVTHPEVNRYFMTIPEAAQMIIQAAAMGEGGEVFILRMGTPVKILDMAIDLIRLSGKEPEKDIEIVFTGLREGEKLYEELITVGEEVEATKHEKIMVLQTDGSFSELKSPAEAQDWLNDELRQLYELSLLHDSKAIKKKLKEIVPEYSPQETESILR